MTSDPIPMATVWAAPAGAPVDARPPVPVEAITPAEVEAIARRIRVEAKLGRITVVGTALGLVCGTAALWPFLDGSGYMAETLISGDLGDFAFFPGWLLAGLLPLLAFYAGRLRFETGKSSTGDIETSLRKIRRIILGAMFASLMAFVAVLAGREDGRGREDAASWMPLMYAACFAACAFVVGDVRRGLGDFDSEHQRRRRKLARGFAVEFRPANVPAWGDGIPLATRAGDDGAPAPSVPVPAFPPPLPSQATPPALPATARTAAALPAAALDATAGEDDHSRDVRLLMTLAMAVAVPIYAVRLGRDLIGGLGRAGYFMESLGSLYGGDLFDGPDAIARLLMFLALVATMLLVPCALLWLVWAVLSLNFGPVFRRAVGWLAAVTLVLGITCVLPSWVYGVETSENSRRGVELNMLSRAPEIVHALFVAALLTRPAVIRLFARSSATDDRD